MGYCMTQHDSKFTIKVENQAYALADMLKLADRGGRFHWVDASDFNQAETLSEVLSAWAWEPKLDESGNITGIAFAAEKAGDETTLWNTLAPYVEPGSYIEMAGEDGAAWRWVFDGKTCTEVEPKW